MALTVNLIGPSPWGFRIFGGRDFKKAITISKVNGGSKAEQADLQPGDIILEINGENTVDMLNVEAQNKIKNSKTHLQLVVERPEPSSPGQTNGMNTPEQLTERFQVDENQNYRDYSVSSPTSLFSPESPTLLILRFPGLRVHSWGPWTLKSRLFYSIFFLKEFSTSDFRNNSFSSRTPTPPGRASPQSPVERDVPMSPRRSSDFAMQRFDRDSEVFKMIQENKESRTTPRQSNTFKMLQEVLEADEKEAALRFPGKLSPNPPKPGPSVGGVSKSHTCAKCGSSILNQVVRITDGHYLHPECYTCPDCGLNLRMRGHFWAGNVMYCEKHAKDRYQGPGSSLLAPCQ
uniref:PDZ and LIM domain protein 2 n=1 Tax=Oryzias sinensis TaxID=183150 RepID=A0A8C7Z675_9TELE